MYAFPFDEVILLVGIYLKGLKTGTGTINRYCLLCAIHNLKVGSNLSAE